MLTPPLIDELNEWVQNPLFLESERPFARVGEHDVVFRPKITQPDGIVEYHTGESK